MHSREHLLCSGHSAWLCLTWAGLWVGILKPSLEPLAKFTAEPKCSVLIFVKAQTAFIILYLNSCTKLGCVMPGRRAGWNYRKVKWECLTLPVAPSWRIFLFI